ncbi:hypothetical protein FVF58_09335 [Paraburkholderia panacisoli]|uniref:Uncharacterized protein n=1 Tax=Paraburkholderia panacisoli TaxID=2603818 RepID=A0A5B0HCF3_9BURK|nr:hypothetical protein [Paraburkholderia panacisoli]KAA1012986.1 hypothetical protein FVF58_09335 [Paraburkholderia panacisoli]
MKVTIKGFINARKTSRYDLDKHGYVEGMEFDFSTYDRTAHDSEIVIVRQHEFEIDVPDDFDPREGMVANLEREKRKLTAEFQARVTQLNSRIQSLLAIENNPTEVA